MKINKLKDLCEKIGSGATPKGGKEIYDIEGISLIRSQNVIDYVFSTDGLVYINDERADKLNAVAVSCNDVLINITGDSVARVCLAPNNVLPARVNQHVCIIRPRQDEILPEYLMYYLINIKDYLLQNASSGGTRNALTKSMLENLLINYHEIPIQKKIIDVLSPICQKIVLNRKEICKYNELIVSIFHNWFGSLDSQLHKENWGISNVYNEIVEIKGKNRENGNYPVLSVVKEGEFRASEDVFTKQVYSKSTTNYKIVKRNQVAYNPARANIGSIAMLKGYEIGLVSPIYIVFEMKETITPTYFYYYMKQPMFLESIKHHAIGTTRQNFPFEAFKMFPIVVPPMELQLEFEKIAKPIEEKIAKLKEENEVLTEIRDALLPKLMNGEISFEEGEKQ